MSDYDKVQYNRLVSTISFLNKYSGCMYCKLNQCDRTIPFKTYQYLKRMNKACVCLKRQADDHPDHIEVVTIEEDTTQLEDISDEQLAASIEKLIKGKDDWAILNKVMLKHLPKWKHVKKIKDFIKVKQEQKSNISNSIIYFDFTQYLTMLDRPSLNVLNAMNEDLAGRNAYDFRERHGLPQTSRTAPYAPKQGLPINPTPLKADIGKMEYLNQDKMRHKPSWSEATIQLSKTMLDPNTYQVILETHETARTLNQMFENLSKNQHMLKEILRDTENAELIKTVTESIDKLHETVGNFKEIMNAHKNTLNDIFEETQGERFMQFLVRVVGVIMGFALYHRLPTTNDRVLLFFNQLTLLGIPGYLIKLIGRSFDTTNLLEKQSALDRQDFSQLVGPSAQLLSLGIVAATTNSSSNMVSKVIKAGNVARTFTNVKNMTDMVKMSIEEGRKTLFHSVTGLPGSTVDSLSNLEPLTLWMDMVRDTLDNPHWMASYMEEPDNQEIVDEMIAKGELVLSECLANVEGEAAKFRTFIKNNLDRFRKISTSMKMAFTGNRSRPLPVSVLFYGPANTGKTFTCTILASDLLSLQPPIYQRRFKEVDQIIYSKPQDSDYFSGYNGQFVYMKDELFQIDDKQERIKELNAVFQFVQETSSPLNQAELDLKGKVHFTSKFLMFTTNKTNFNDISVDSKPALIRRFHYTVTPAIKDAFRIDERLNLPAWLAHCRENNLPPTTPNHSLFYIQDNTTPNNPIELVTYTELVQILHTAQQRNEERYSTTKDLQQDRLRNPFILPEEIPRARAEEYTGNADHVVDFWQQADDESQDQKQRSSVEDLKKKMQDFKERVETSCSYKINDAGVKAVSDYYKDSIEEIFRLLLIDTPQPNFLSEEEKLQVFFNFIVFKHEYIRYSKKMGIDTSHFKNFTRKQYEEFVWTNKLPSPGLFKLGWIRFKSFIKRNPLTTAIVALATISSIIAIVAAFSSGNEESTLNKFKRIISNTKEVPNQESAVYNNQTNKNKLPAFKRNYVRESEEYSIMNNIAVRNQNLTEITKEAEELYAQAISDHNLEQQLCKIMHNTIKLKISTTQFFEFGTNRTLRGLILRPDVILFNTHLLEKYDLNKSFIKIETHNSSITLATTELTLHHMGKRWNYPDVTLALLPKNKLQGRDIIGMIATEEQIKNFHDGWGELIVTDAEKIITRHASHISALTTNNAININGIDYDITRGFTYNASTKEGDCGSPLVRWDNQSSGKIIGLHAAGGLADAHKAYATTIDRDWIIDTLREYNLYKMNADNDMDDLEPITTSEYTHLMPEAMNILGKAPIKTTIPLGQSHIVPSDFQKNGFAKPKEAPANRTIRGPDSSLAKVLRKFRKETPYVDTQLTRKITKTLALTYFNDPDKKTDIFTPEEALNVLQNIRSIDISTSMGFPFCTQKLKKKDFILYNEDRQKYEFKTEELLNLVVSKIEMMRQQELPEFIFVNCLKDERLPIEKVADNKVRLFMLCPFDLTIIVRMYFGSFINHIHSKIFQLGVCVGIAPQEIDWHQLAMSLLQHSQKMIAIDYSNWDRSIPIEFLNVFFDLADMYYSDEHSDIRRGVRKAILNPVYQLNWFRYTVQSGNPSGCPVTSELNSIANLSMTLYVLTKAGHEFMEVFRKTFVATYGDDSVISTGVGVQIEELAEQIELLGLIATNSSKTGSIQVQGIDEVIFLKRNFVFFNGRYHAPLLMDTIQEMLLWVQRGTNQRANFQCTVTNAMNELEQYPPQQVTEIYLKIMNFCYRCNYKFQMTEHALSSMSYSMREAKENYVENTMIYAFKKIWNLLSISKMPLTLEEVANFPVTVNYVGIDVGKRIPLVTSEIFFHVGFRHEAFPGKELTFSDKGICFINGNYVPDFEYEVQISLELLRYKIVNPVPYDLVRNNCITFCEEIITNYDNIPPEHQRLFKRLHERTMVYNTWLYRHGADDEITEGDTCQDITFMGAQQTTTSQSTRTLPSLLETNALVHNFTWGVGQNKGHTTKIAFPRVIKQSAQFSQKLSFNTLIKTDLHITVEVTNPVALCGALFITWIPCASEGFYEGFVYNIHSCSSMQHYILSVPDNNVLDLEIPFNNFKNFLDLNRFDSNELGELYISVLSPLLKAAESTEKEVTVMVYANLKNVQMIVTTPLTAQSTWSGDSQHYPNILKKESDEAELKTTEGIISGPATTISKVARLVSGLPVVSGIASTISVMAGGVATIAEAMGLSKPRNLGVTTFVTPRMLTNVGYADAQDNGTVLGLNPKNHVVIQPSLFGSDYDEMNIAYLVRRPSFIYQTHWDKKHKLGATLIALPVHPFVGNKSKVGDFQCNQMSHMGYIASTFSYWRGSINYTFEIYSTASHSGSLIIGFIPRGSWSSTEPFNYETTIKKRIQLTSQETKTVVTLTVPFISTQMMNPLKTPFSQIDLTEDSATGTIILKVEKPLVVTPLVSDKLYINVWVSAGEDFDLSLPDLNKLRNISYFSKILSQADSDLPDTSPTIGQRFDLVMGESILSLRQLLKVSVLKFQSKFKLFEGYNQIVFPAHTFSGSDDDLEVHDTYYTHFMRLYRFSRGSIRHKILFRSFEGQVSAIMSHSDNPSYEWTRDQTLEGAPWCTTHAKFAPYLEYEIPFYSATKTQIHNSDGSTRSAVLQFLNFEHETLSNRLTLYESVGDDFSAGFLMGVPPLYLKPTILSRFMTMVENAKAISSNALLDDYYVIGKSKTAKTLVVVGGTEYKELVVQPYYYTSYMKHYTLLIAKGGSTQTQGNRLFSVDNTTSKTASFYFCLIDKNLGDMTKKNNTWPMESGHNSVWFYFHASDEIYIKFCGNTCHAKNPQTGQQEMSVGTDFKYFNIFYPREDIVKELFKLVDSKVFKSEVSMSY